MAITKVTSSVLEAAQPNITSLGTLTGLTVSATTATVNITGSNTGASLINLGDAADGNVGRIYYDHSADFMQFKAADGERLRINSTGIDVTGTVTADGLTVDGDATLQTSDGAILNIGTTDTSATTGDVIGQLTFVNADTSPNKTNAEIRGMANDAFGRTNIDFRTGNSGTLNTRALISWNGDISFYDDTGVSQALFWDASAESLGIGTTSPSSKLHVVGSEVLFDNTGGDFTLKLNTNAVGDKNEIIMGDTSTPLAKFGVGGTANDIITGSDGQDFNIGTAGGGRAINFSTDNFASVEMKLDGGNLLVGTTSNASGQRLHLESGADFGQIGLRNSSSTAGKFWYVGPATNNTFVIYNQAPSGVYLTDGATSWTGASDESLKENIVELTGALDKVKNFRCVEYNFISDETNSKKIGFIAQDWQEDYSQVVSQDHNGNLGMQYTETIPVLLKAIQEQQAIIDNLTTRIETLENA